MFDLDQYTKVFQNDMSIFVYTNILNDRMNDNT